MPASVVPTSSRRAAALPDHSFSHPEPILGPEGRGQVASPQRQDLLAGALLIEIHFAGLCPEVPHDGVQHLLQDAVQFEGRAGSRGNVVEDRQFLIALLKLFFVRLQPLIEARIGDGNGRVGSQRFDQSLVFLAELRGPNPVGDVDLPDRPALSGDRHTQEAAHMRMIGGKTRRTGVGRDIRDAHRPALAQDRADQPASLRLVFNSRGVLRGHPGGDKAFQLALPVRNADCREPRMG